MADVDIKKPALPSDKMNAKPPSNALDSIFSTKRVSPPSDVPGKRLQNHELQTVQRERG